jgi:thiol:disulfide interchange protein
MSRLLIATALAAVAIVAPAQSAERQPYTRAALAAAQAQGRPILVEVKAWWCPVCSSQGRTIKQTTAAPAYNNLLILSIDYDKQKDDWKALGAQKQSTLIGYRGTKELGRVVYTTDKAQINALLARTIG